MYFYGMNQQQQWQKEAEAIKLLVDKYGAKDTHAQTSLGYDIILNGKLYDLKVSNSQKLTVLKRLGKGPRAGEIYSPLLEHQDIDYLYMIEKPNLFIGFLLNKCDVLDFIIKNAGKLKFSYYNGDGNDNFNVYFSFSDLDLVAYKSLNFSK
jgi:hypothetical protein